MDTITNATPLSGLTISGAQPEACAACGAQPEACGCARLRHALQQRAAALQRAGLAAARDGELHRALALLRRAGGVAPLDECAARVLALAALCLGETGVAARAWIGAGTNAEPLLDVAPVREGLRLYNEALAEAQGGNAGAAAARVGAALEHLPDLVPAHRLRALLAAERGDVPAARAAGLAGLAVCRVDLLLQRCLAALPADPSTAVPAPAPSTVPATAPRRGRRFNTPLGAAWAGSIILAVAVTRMLGGPAAGRVAVPPPPAPRPAPAAATTPAPAPAAPATAAPPFDFAAYRRGREAFARADWQGAIGALSPAAAAPASAYYRDDALYLLARAQARAARPGDARGTAALLLAQHPASIFANRITRHIAQQGTE